MAHGLQLLRGIWHLPGPGIKPVSPESSGKPMNISFWGDHSTQYSLSCQIFASVRRLVGCVSLFPLTHTHTHTHTHTQAHAHMTHTHTPDHKLHESRTLCFSEPQLRAESKVDAPYTFADGRMDEQVNPRRGW